MTYQAISEPYIKNRNKYVLCLCGCGKKREVRLNDVSKIKSCKYCNGRQYVGKISGEHFGDIKYSAKKRNLEFNITKEYIWDLYLKQDGKCKLTGWPINFADGKFEQKHGVTTASLDRIDSSLGYIKGNVQWLHKHVNFIKQQFNEKYLIEICKAIVEKNNEEKVPNTDRTGGELIYQIIVGPCVGGFGPRGSFLGFSSEIAA
jgi:hypothetical protein